MVEFNYEKTLYFCNKGIEEFGQRKNIPHTILSALYHQKATCLTQLGKFLEAAETLDKSLGLFHEGIPNWFKSVKLYTNLQLLSGEYQSAWQLTQKAILHKRFSNIQSADKETWKVFEAWLHFLIKKELIQLDPKEEKNIKKFRLNKFLNEVPSYSKDKSGLNIPILVVQMLFLLSNKQYKAINDRLEALEKYVVRHLKGPQNIRSNAFMKMLLQVGKCSFHLTAIERKTKRLHQKLLDTPLHSARQAHEIEIIPYETIWGWVVEELDRQFH